MKDQNRVFVSYGHVEEEICKKICAYLENEGFKPWVDTTKLRHGMLWRDEIRKGIEDSGQVVALLSAYSTRDRGVCLDEISIAVGVTGGNIHTILLQEENIINVPPTIGFEQWFDMSDWKKKKAEGDQAYNEWFKAKMDDVIRRLRDPEHVEKYGQITELRKKLNVQYAVGRQQKLLNEHYTGRKWLGEKIDAWLEDPNAPRRCLVTGAPGVGKSAFAVHYAHYNPKTAAALFFSADMPNYNDPCVVIQTLAYLLACRLSAYRKSLLWELNQEDHTTLAKLTEKELFDKLITRPLSQAINGNHPAMCIILDGLEECGDPQKNTLAKTIARYADSLPWWLHILIVARDVPAVKNYTKNALRIEMRGEDKNNLDDVREYYREALEEKFGSDPAWPETLEQITVRSQGIFLYAKMLTSLLLDKGTLDVGGDYPEGLREVFTLWFDWFFPDGEDYARRWRLPIGCVLGSPDPIPAQTLRRVFDWSENELADFEARLSILLRKGKNVFGDETLVFDHDFVKEWLSSGAGENFYFSSPEDGRKKMAHALYAVFEEDAEELTYWEAVNLLDLPLTKKQRGKAVESLELSETNSNAGNYCLTWGNIYEAEKIFYKEFKLIKKRDTKKEKNLLYRAWCLESVSYIKLLHGNIEEAVFLCEEMISICEKLVKENNSSENLNMLAEGYGYKGNIFLKKGFYDEALKFHQKAISVDTKALEKKQTFESWKRLAECYYNVGISLRFNGDDFGALEIHRRAVKIEEKLLKENEITKTEETRKHLAAGYGMIGMILRKQGYPQPAIEWLQKAYSIYEKVLEKANTPDNRRRLAVTFYGIGSCFESQNRITEALDMYKKASIIQEEVCKKLDIPEENQELSRYYDEIGYALLLQKDFDEAIKWLKKSHDICEDLYSKIETCESQRRLAENNLLFGIYYEKYGNLKKALEFYNQTAAITDKLVTVYGSEGLRKDAAYIKETIEFIKKKLGGDK